MPIDDRRRRWRGWPAFALILLLWVAPLAARTLERGNGPEPDTLDPQRAQGLSAQQILRDLFEGLMRDDATGELVPGAAESFEISADGLRYRFRLRADGRYADGSAVTATDFVYALNRALDPATAAPSAAMLLPIVGAEARLRGEAVELLGVEAEGLAAGAVAPPAMRVERARSVRTRSDSATAASYDPRASSRRWSARRIAFHDNSTAPIIAFRSFCWIALRP